MKIALIGYGRMGKTLDALAPDMGFEVVARLDAGDEISAAALNGAAVAIEFTLPEAAPAVLKTLAALNVSAVSGTTGWGSHLDEVHSAFESSRAGLIHASNFSIGVALFRRLVQRAAELFDSEADYDLRLNETHHEMKLDHPSGTAITLAEDVLANTKRKRAWLEQSPDQQIDDDQLGITVVRTGSVPGTHVLSLDGPDDRIELRHEALSRDGFARGALRAARWIHGRSGVFTLDDLLNDQTQP